MRVRFLVPGVLRADAAGLSTVDVEVPVPNMALRGDEHAAVALGDALDALGAAYPRLARRVRDEQGEIRRYVNVYVGGEDSRLIGGLATPVPPESEIQLMPSVAGG